MYKSTYSLYFFGYSSGCEDTLKFVALKTGQELSPKLRHVFCEIELKEEMRKVE